MHSQPTGKSGLPSHLTRFGGGKVRQIERHSHVLERSVWHKVEHIPRNPQVFADEERRR